MRLNKDEIKNGDRFGSLTILEFLGRRKDVNWWKCVCDCGEIIEKRTCCLIKGCRKCKDFKKGWKGFGEIGRSLFGYIKDGAAFRNLEFNITIESIWSLFLKQQGKCALSGFELAFANSTKTKKNRTASLDRIDSTKGYNEDNVQWIHKDINMMKQELNQDKFLKLCRLVIDKNNNITHSFPEINKITIKRGTRWNGYKEISGNFFWRVKNSAKRRNLILDFDIKFLWELYQKQDGKCFLTGLPIKFNDSFYIKNGTASVDRINSSLGYLKDNVCFLHRDINFMKQNFTLEYFISLCSDIVKFKSPENFNQLELENLINNYSRFRRKYKVDY